MWESGIEWLPATPPAITWSYSNGILTYTSGKQYLVQSKSN